MELRTFFRRDLKKMRGTILCMAVLSMLIVMLGSVTFSIRDGFRSGMKEAISRCDGADIIASVYADADIGELYRDLEQDPNTGRVVTIELLDGIDAPTVGKTSYGNSTYYSSQSQMDGHYRLYTQNCDGFEKEIPRLKENEIYLPIGLKSFFGCKVGDTLSDSFGAITVTDENGNVSVSNEIRKNFTIKGFVQMPESGSSVIGQKNIILSDADYDILYEISQRGTAVVRENHVCNPPYYNFCQKNLLIYRSDTCTLSSKEYTRYLNENLDFCDRVEYSINRYEYEDYSGLYINIFYKIVLAFSAILLIIVIIVITNNISSDIENDYSELGILKALGFSNRKLQLRMGMIYIFAEFIGAAVGFVASGFISKLFAVAMISNTGVLSSTYFVWEKSLLLIVGILLVSLLCIAVKTLFLRKISPVKAVNDKKDDVYFDHRGTVPVGGRALSFKVALRAVTSEPKRFIGISFITAVLCFAMLIAAGTSNMLKDDNVMNAMGLEYTDFFFRTYTNLPLTDDATEKIFSIVGEYTEVEHFYDSGSLNLLLNGDSVFCKTYKHPKEIGAILKGRAPLYPNEFMCTQKICNAYNLSIGDEVTLSLNGTKAAYILSGINQSMTEAGSCITINLDGLHRLDDTIQISYIGIDLKDDKHAKEIIQRINELYEEDYGRARISSDKEDFSRQLLTSTIIAKLVIFSFSIIFFFVTINMMVTKAFLKERKDLGIYKALGFTSTRLRVIFALRFTVVSGFGAVAGIILGLLFSGKVLGLALSITGISYLSLNYSLLEIIIVLLACFTTIFLSGYLTSSKIKKVEVKELIVE